MKDLPKRLLTALVFGIIVIGSVFLSTYTFSFLIFLIAGIGLHEFYSLAKHNGFSLNAPILVLLGAIQAVIFILYFNDLIPGYIVMISAVIPFILMIYELYRKSNNPIGNIAVSVFGWIYIVLPLVLLMWCAYSISDEVTFHYSYEFVIGYLILIWSSDTGAYFSGVTFGKRKLFKSISPKKSWEGFVGGLMLSIVASLILFVYFPMLSRIDWIMLSLIIVISGAFGDLVESMFKRSAQVKDSGSILPGHGGVLDRFDALFCSAPFVFLYLLFTRALV